MAAARKRIRQGRIHIALDEGAGDVCSCAGVVARTVAGGAAPCFLYNLALRYIWSPSLGDFFLHIAWGLHRQGNAVAWRQSHT